LTGRFVRETAARSASSFLLSGQDSRWRMQATERGGPGMVYCLLDGAESRRGQPSRRWGIAGDGCVSIGRLGGLGCVWFLGPCGFWMRVIARSVWDAGSGPSAIGTIVAGIDTRGLGRHLLKRETCEWVMAAGGGVMGSAGCWTGGSDAICGRSDRAVVLSA
jgi:hypothetical protein